MSGRLSINREAYEKEEDAPVAEHRGCTALYHDGKRIGIFEDDSKAYIAGCEVYEPGSFSLITIGESVIIDLGLLGLCFVDDAKSVPGDNDRTLS